MYGKPTIERKRCPGSLKFDVFFWNPRGFLRCFHQDIVQELDVPQRQEPKFKVWHLQRWTTIRWTTSTIKSSDRLTAPPTTTRKCHLWRDRNDLHWKLWSLRIWSSQNSLVVSTLLKNVNQIGNIPQIGVNIKNTFELPPPRFDHPKTVQNGHDASHSSPSQKLHLAVVAVVAFDEVRLHRKSWVPVAIVFAYLYPIFVGQYWKIILQVKLEWNHLTKEEKTTCSWCVWLSKPHSHDLSWLILGKLNPFPNYAKFAEVCPMARWCRISSVYSEETNCCFPIEDVEVFQIFVR